MNPGPNEPGIPAGYDSAAFNMELMDEADGTRGKAHDENLIIKAEPKAALSLAHGLRAVAEDAERRSRLESERAEARRQPSATSGPSCSYPTTGSRVPRL